MPDTLTQSAPPAPAPPPPARPRRLRSGFAQLAEEIVLDYPAGSRAGGLFLLLWLIGWTVGCVFLVREVLRGPDLFTVLFALPFFAAWLFVFAMVAHAFLGRERLVLGPQGASFSRRILRRYRARQVPLEEIVGFREGLKPRGGEQGPARVLEMLTLGESVAFGEVLPQRERDWLQHVLHDHLARLKVSAGLPAADDAATAAAAGVSPPTDTRWVRNDDFDVVFEQRGRFEPAAAGGLLFVNVFWNGIVGVFLCVRLGVAPAAQPQGGAWWALCVFLVPFEAIGLVMFGALVAALLEPFRVTRWRFALDRIEHRVRRLGLGPRREYSVDRLDRIDLVPPDDPDGTEPRDLSAWLETLHRGGPGSELVVIGRDGTEVCTIPNLTTGEAAWMRAAILSERAEWFRPT